MLSLRSIVRSVPRTLVRSSARASIRPLASFSQSSILQQAWRIAPKTSHAAFTTSSSFYAPEAEGIVDQELSIKLGNELQMEQDMNESEDLPPHLQEYLDSSPFQLHDVPGEEEVVLTRSYGNEKIRVTFSIADLTALDPEDDTYDHDKALYDERDGDISSDLQSGGAQSEGAINQTSGRDGNFKVAPEDKIAPADREDLDEPMDEGSPSFPSRINITIEKPGVEGALQLDTVAEDGVIAVENVYYFKKSAFADAKTAEQDWARRLVYTGPPYANLDEDLQILFEKYLDERGINTALALFVPEYIDHKEQKEYLTWLSDIKSFVDK